MELGVYESLLTEALIRELHQDDDLLPQYGNVDDAEQPLAIARHLTPIIERSLRGAGTAENRMELARRILEVLSDSSGGGEALHQIELGKISRLEEVVSGTALKKLVCRDLQRRLLTVRL